MSENEQIFINEHYSAIGATIDITLQECLWVLLECLAKEKRSHLVRCQLFAELMLDSMQKKEEYVEIVTEEYKALLLSAVPLHDIGKVLVSNAIIFKQDKLTDSEYQVAKEHAGLGVDLIKKVENNIGNNPLIDMIKDINAYHHERWDGKGYPMGVSGEDIPLAARLMAIVDTYDSMSAKRGAADVFAHGEAKTIIKTASGAFFDPGLVDIFSELSQQFRSISLRYTD